MPESVVRGYCDQSVLRSAKPNTSLNERTKHSSSTFMVSVSVPSMSNMTRCMGKRPNENKMSDGGRGRASLGLKVWKSSQKWSVRRSAVRSIAWLGVTTLIGASDEKIRILPCCSRYQSPQIWSHDHLRQ